ncbi:MAG: hypothetical protein ACOC2D_04645 [Spirochaetota bacterium]
MRPDRELPARPHRIASAWLIPPPLRYLSLVDKPLARRALRLLVVAAIVVAAAGCDRSAPDEPQEPADADASAEVAELAAIGGVQDVWAFEFGLDADRDTVREHLGAPAARTESEESGRAGALRIVVWRYDRLEVTFLVDAATESEYLLSVKVLDPSVPTRGGLEVGMELERAIDLLGEPRVIDDGSLVWFYRNTTIELVVSDDEVEAIHLARALP